MPERVADDRDLTRFGAVVFGRNHAAKPRGDAEQGPTLLERTADGHPSAAVERSAIGTELAQRITRCVEGLPTEQREVFLLRELGTNEDPAVTKTRWSLTLGHIADQAAKRKLPWTAL